jgi:hypothetical protein
MTISVVNGFVCTSSCDVAKAKKGQDPHPLTGAEKIAAEKEQADADPAKTGDPAVVFGGVLATGPAAGAAPEAVQPVKDVASAAGVDRRVSGAAVDLLV